QKREDPVASSQTGSPRVQKGGAGGRKCKPGATGDGAEPRPPAGRRPVPAATPRSFSVCGDEIVTHLEAMHGLVAVAPLPPVPRHDLLTYRVPEPLRERVRPGVRVRVPLGRQTRTGVVAAFADALPPGELRSIVDVLDVDPFLPADLLELRRWTARYQSAPRPTLTQAQHTAADAIAQAVAGGAQTCFLLHGIAGSGKTEVLLAAAAATLAAGREVVLLVPEIALTHQLVERVRGRFGSEVAVLHSGLGPRERWSEWRRILSGHARVVVGARPAVLAPARRLGLVVVDEEH